jgi:hemerythrin superfamily protein
MYYICAQPAETYFYWQIRTMLFSFSKQGVAMDKVHVVLGIRSSLSEQYKSLIKEYPTVLFATYQDERTPGEYAAGAKPYLMHKHYKKHKWLEREAVFFHDCDIALTKPLDFQDMLQDDILYLSDTVSYLGYEYIKSKGDRPLEIMLEIVGISEHTVKQNQDHSGGAQYLLKSVDEAFWAKTYADCKALYKALLEHNSTLEKTAEYPIQVWCAEMWATLWNLWARGLKTRVDSRLEFSWATYAATEYDRCAIYHNAGVNDAQSGMFYKGAYTQVLPYNLELQLNASLASHNYYLLVQESNLTQV